MSGFPLLGIKNEEILSPLVLTSEICETPENVRRNIEATLNRKYVRFNEYLADPHDGVISLCGSAPSFKQSYHQVKGDVYACNAAHDFLIERGIVPKYAMLWDAAELMTGMAKPNKDVKYLIASRCHESLFEQFSNSDVVVWHAEGDACLEDLLVKYNRREPMIGGGSAAVVRAMFVAFAMGYRKMHLFGVDGSFSEDETHVRKSLVDEPDMQVYVEGKWFRTASWAALQAEDFKLIAPALRDAGTKITIYGDGMIPHIAKTLGFAVNPNSTT